MAVPKSIKSRLAYCVGEFPDAILLVGVFNGLLDKEFVFEDNEEPADNEEVESDSRFVLNKSFFFKSNFVLLDLEHSLVVKSVASEYEDEEDSELDLEEDVGLLDKSFSDMSCSA